MHVICIGQQSHIYPAESRAVIGSEVANLERRIEAEEMPALVAKITQQHLVLHI